MPSKDNARKSKLAGIKAPLGFSFVLGLIAFTVVSITSSGGSADGWRFDLGLTAFGIAFASSLVIVSLLMMTSQENPRHISEGSGIHRNSEETFRKQEAERARKQAEKKAQEESDKPEDGKAAS